MVENRGLMLLCCAGCAVFTAAAVAGVPVILSDSNSSMSVDLGSPMGQYNWTVDGVNQLTQEWFSYAIGAGSPLTLDSIGAAQNVNPQDLNADGNLDTLYAKYTASDFTVEVTFGLTGGSVGSGMSDLLTNIRIRNTSNTVLPFHFFDSANFDLNGSAPGDSVEVVSNNVVRQTKGLVTVLETVLTPAASQVVVGGPPDATWTLRWDTDIRPGGTLLISNSVLIFQPYPHA